MALNKALADILPKRQPDQVAYVVADLAESIREWRLALGNDDWKIYTYSADNVQDLEYQGTPGNFSMRLALCGSNPQVELIESLEGHSLYSGCQLGLHHVGWFIDDLASATATLDRVGCPAVQRGRGYGLDGDGGFAYYEVDTMGGLIELIEVPARRRPSEAVPAT